MLFHQGKIRILWLSFILLSFSVASVNGSALAPAQETSNDSAEASEFFKKVASQTHNPLIAGLAQENVSRLQQKHVPVVTRQVVIPLMEQPDTSLVAPILINSKVMATFMVDTGSSYTVITPALAQKLGIVITPDTPKVSLITANGVIESPIVILRNISVGGVKVSEVSAVVQQLGNGDDLLLSGLLGMNFFKGMDLSIHGDQLVIGVRNSSPD